MSVFPGYECRGTLVGQGFFCIAKEYKCKNTGKKFIGKELRKEWEEKADYISRFKSEVEITESLREHNNIISIIDAHINQPPYTYLMEFAETNLTNYMRYENQKLKIEKRLKLFDQILEAIAYAHSQGCLHRDLSPNNVLLLKKDDALIVKVADFGLGKVLNSDLFNTGSSVYGYGTPIYTAPEQRNQLNNATTQSDIYSLGRLLRFILTGKCPDNPYEKEEPFKDFITKATETKPENRFTNTEDFKYAYTNIKKDSGYLPEHKKQEKTHIADSEEINIPTSEWEQKIRLELEKFSEKISYADTKRLEIIFAVAARRLEKPNNFLDKELYKKIFRLQMDLLSQLYLNNGLYGPKTRLPQKGYDFGCEWIADCWSWDLSGVISQNMITKEDIRVLFPFSGKPNLDFFVKTLNEKTSREQPILAYLNQNERDSFSDECVEYYRLTKLSILLIEKIELPEPIANQSLLLFPAWLISQIKKGVRELNIIPFLSSYYRFKGETNRQGWYDYLIDIAEEHASEFLSEIATVILKNLIQGQASNYGGYTSIIEVYSRLEKHPSLYSFLYENNDINNIGNFSIDIVPQRVHEYNKLSKLPNYWINWLISQVIRNKKSIQLFVKYIENSDKKNRIRWGECISENSWNAIFDELEKSWIAIKNVWNIVPHLAQKRAISKLQIKSPLAKDWFSESPYLRAEQLCQELIKIEKQENTGLPEWCLPWLIRISQGNEQLLDEYYDEIEKACEKYDSKGLTLDNIFRYLNDNMREIKLYAPLVIGRNLYNVGLKICKLNGDIECVSCFEIGEFGFLMEKERSIRYEDIERIEYIEAMDQTMFD